MAVWAVGMSFEYHQDASGSKVPHLDAAVVGHRREKVGVPETKCGLPDSILIFEQQLVFPAGKAVEEECIPAADQKRSEERRVGKECIYRWWAYD